MIKKTYLAILCFAIVSVSLGSLFYSNVAFAPRPIQPIQVEVINFPSDALTLTAIPNSSFVEALSNFTFWVTTPSQDGYYLTVNVEGWKKAYVYWQWDNPDFDSNIHASIWIYFKSRIGEIPHHITDSEGEWLRNTPRFTVGSFSLEESSPPPTTIELKGSLLDIDLYLNPDTPISQATIALYLYLTR